jgi:hypothetical protein
VGEALAKDFLPYAARGTGEDDFHFPPLFIRVAVGLSFLETRGFCWGLSIPLIFIYLILEDGTRELEEHVCFCLGLYVKA